MFSARRIPKETLHASIREDVWSLYHQGKYDTAVFEAMKAVEVAVREAGEMSDSLLGVKLMRAAFSPSPNAGPLTDANAEGGEQVARMELFAGAQSAPTKTLNPTGTSPWMIPMRRPRSLCWQIISSALSMPTVRRGQVLHEPARWRSARQRQCRPRPGCVLSVITAFWVRGEPSGQTLVFISEHKKIETSPSLQMMESQTTIW